MFRCQRAATTSANRWLDGSLGRRHFHPTIGSKHRLSTQRRLSPGPHRRGTAPPQPAPSLLLSSPASAWLRATESDGGSSWRLPGSLRQQPAFGVVNAQQLCERWPSLMSQRRRVSANDIMKLVPVPVHHPPPCRRRLLRVAIASPGQRPARNNRPQNNALHLTRSVAFRCAALAGERECWTDPRCCEESTNGAIANGWR